MSRRLLPLRARAAGRCCDPRECSASEASRRALRTADFRNPAWQSPAAAPSHPLYTSVCRKTACLCLFKAPLQAPCPRAKPRADAPGCCTRCLHTSISAACLHTSISAACSRRSLAPGIRRHPNAQHGRMTARLAAPGPRPAGSARAIGAQLSRRQSACTACGRASDKGCGSACANPLTQHAAMRSCYAAPRRAASAPDHGQAAGSGPASRCTGAYRPGTWPLPAAGTGHRMAGAWVHALVL